MGSFGVDITADNRVENAGNVAKEKLTYSPLDESDAKADSGLVTFVGLHLSTGPRHDQ